MVWEGADTMKKSQEPQRSIQSQSSFGDAKRDGALA